MPEIREANQPCQQETDEEPPFYIPRCLTEFAPPDEVVVEERKSNKAEGSISHAENSFVLDKPKLDDDLVI